MPRMSGRLAVGQRARRQHHGAGAKASCGRLGGHASSTPSVLSKIRPVTSVPNRMWLAQVEPLGDAPRCARRSRLPGSRRATSPGSWRTRTSTAATECRRPHPGYVLSRQVPPTRSAAFEDDDVLDAGLAQLDRRAEAGEAGADDQRGVACDVVASAALLHACTGSWVSSLNQLGIGRSSGLG